VKTTRKHYSQKFSSFPRQSTMLNFICCWILINLIDLIWMKGVTGSLVASYWVGILWSYNAPCSQRYRPEAEVHFSDGPQLQNRPMFVSKPLPSTSFKRSSHHRDLEIPQKLSSFPHQQTRLKYNAYALVLIGKRKSDHNTMVLGKSGQQARDRIMREIM